jgi:hypothetical protein
MRVAKQTVGCLVRAESLHPGDIFLTRGRAKECRLIKALSNVPGEFAHAGVVIDPNHLFEADDDGVGATYLPSVSLEQEGVVSRWVYVPYAPGTFVLLRHAKLAAGNREQVARRVLAACQHFDGMPYAKFPALLDASWLTGLPRTLLGWYLRWCDPRRQDSPLDGLICSELVVKIYRELGIELFNCDLVDRTVSPNMLASLESLDKVRVTDGLDETQARALVPEISFAKLFEESQSKRGLVEHLSVFTDSMATINRMLARLRADLEAERRETVARFELFCARTRHEMQLLLQRSVHQGDLDRYNRVARFQERFDNLYPLARHGLAGADPAARAPFVDAYYRLCLVALQFQYNVTRWAQEAVRAEHVQGKGLRGLFQRRSARLQHLRLSRRRAHLRAEMDWFLERRNQMPAQFPTPPPTEDRAN